VKQGREKKTAEGGAERKGKVTECRKQFVLSREGHGSGLNREIRLSISSRAIRPRRTWPARRIKRGNAAGSGLSARGVGGGVRPEVKEREKIKNTVEMKIRESVQETRHLSASP